MGDQAQWAQIAASRLISEFSDVAAIETANYHLCSFILAAAKVVSNDPNLALRIGSLMEPERKARTCL